eukprot:tig00020603_g11798.t1
MPKHDDSGFKSQLIHGHKRDVPYHDAFISFARKDTLTAQLLKTTLERYGLSACCICESGGDPECAMSIPR